MLHWSGKVNTTNFFLLYCDNKIHSKTFTSFPNFFSNFSIPNDTNSFPYNSLWRGPNKNDPTIPFFKFLSICINFDTQLSIPVKTNSEIGISCS